MQTITFTYNKTNQLRIAFLLLAIGLLGAVVALYMWLWAKTIIINILVGGIVLALLCVGFFLKLILAPKKEGDPAITISADGIMGDTTPVAKAAGLINWNDIDGISVFKHEIEIKVKDPEKYAARMKNFFVRDTFLKSLKGTVKISTMETNATYSELMEVLSEYTQP